MSKTAEQYSEKQTKVKKVKSIEHRMEERQFIVIEPLFYIRFFKIYCFLSTLKCGTKKTNFPFYLHFNERAVKI
jgi:hypothetical protein